MTATRTEYRLYARGAYMDLWHTFPTLEAAKAYAAEIAHEWAYVVIFEKVGHGPGEGEVVWRSN